MAITCKTYDHPVNNAKTNLTFFVFSTDNAYICSMTAIYAAIIRFSSNFFVTLIFMCMKNNGFICSYVGASVFRI